MLASLSSNVPTDSFNLVEATDYMTWRIARGLKTLPKGERLRSALTTIVQNLRRSYVVS